MFVLPQAHFEYVMRDKVSLERNEGWPVSYQFLKTWILDASAILGTRVRNELTLIAGSMMII